jgi:hypothetical protein
MLPDKLKIFPWYVLMLPLFFVWHVMNEYFGLFPISFGAWFLVYYLVLAVGLLLVGKLILKNNLKAGVWATVILIIFLFWGSFHDYLKSLRIPALFYSYRFLLSLAAIFIVGNAVLLKKKKNLPQKTHYFFILLFSFFLVWEGCISIYKWIIKQPKNDLAYYNKPLQVKLASIDNKQKPDIFFIVFDEYTSSASLRKYLNYDNSNMDSMLTRKGIYIAKNGKSNYNSTPFSLGSAFNLQYFNLPLENQPSDPKNLLQGQTSFINNWLTTILEKEGYIIKNRGLLDLKKYPAPEDKFFQRDNPGVFYDETLWGRIKKDIWWNIQTRVPEKWVGSEFRKKQAKTIRFNENNFKNILTELNSQTDTPKFVYGHFMLPHRPYYLTKSGQVRNMKDLNSFTRDSLYLDQVIYANTWIDSLTTAASQTFNRPRVVIIEGDHGYRDSYLSDKHQARDIEFMNLSTFYFSDKDYSLLYDSISPVNSFRVIINKYFHSNLPLLKDSTIMIR